MPGLFSRLSYDFETISDNKDKIKRQVKSGH